MNLGDRIKQRMGELNWDPQRLSRESRVPYPTLMGILAGHQKTSTKSPQIALALGVNALWLADGKGTKLIQSDELNVKQPPQDMRPSSQNDIRDAMILAQAEKWLAFEEATKAPADRLQPVRRLERLMELTQMIQADGGTLSPENAQALIDATRRQTAEGADNGRTTQRGRKRTNHH